MIWIKREKIDFSHADPRKYQSHVYMTKGDTCTLTFTLYNKDDEEYTMEQGDMLTFTVRKDDKAEAEIVIESGTARVVLPAEATDNMEVGTYVYDCQLTLKDGSVLTVVPISQFTICEEVSYV